MSTLGIDFETRATVDLTKTGVYPYAMHKDTDIWCMAWAFDDEEPEIWTPGGFVAGLGFVAHALPRRVVEHIEDGGTIRAWNAQFERIIWNEIMLKRYGAPAVSLEQWVDTAAEAAAMSLPRGLDQCAKTCKVTEEKDAAGYRLMMQMTKPRRVEDDGTLVWWTDPAKFERLCAYCKQDVRTERALAKCVRRLTPREQELYWLDQRINDRGVRVDRQLVAAAQDVVDEGVMRANQQIADLTNGDVKEVTQHARLRTWLGTQGVEADSVGKPAVRALLEREDLAQKTRDVLTLRADAGRSSVAKLKSLERVACPDDRLRGLAVYHGAGTGRWTGKLVQPHNFPRGEVDRVEDFIPSVLARDYEGIDLIAHPIVVVLSMLRGMITAEPGKELVVADFSAIEARVLNWLAGQDDVLALFRQYDAAPKEAKPNYDPYRHNAARIYGIPLDQVQKFPHRQTGKFAELGCGFGMGWRKAMTAAKDTYQVELSQNLARAVVQDYRTTHHRVKQFWRDAELAVRRATNNKGKSFYFGDQGRIRAVVAGAYLHLILPSGRPLCYAQPEDKKFPQSWCEVCGSPVEEHVGSDHDYQAAEREQVQVWAVDGYTKQWKSHRLYGGLIVENIVQAVARDLLAEGMFRSEAAGYPVVMHVHDELVAEVPEGFGSVKEFEQLLSTLPEWAVGCPIAAEGWRGMRYRK